MPLTITPAAAANLAAAQIINQVTQVASQINNALANGVPARGNQPAISAADLATALGTVNVAILNAMASALAA